MKIASREKLVGWLRVVYAERRARGGEAGTASYVRGWYMGMAEQAREVLIVLGEPDPAEEVSDG